MDENRIAVIEAELREAREAIATARNYILYMTGKYQIVESAVFALVESHHNAQGIRQALNNHLGPVEATIVSSSGSEDQVRGAQELVLALSRLIDKPE